MPSSRGSSQPRYRTQVSCIAGGLQERDLFLRHAHRWGKSCQHLTVLFSWRCKARTCLPEKRCVSAPLNHDFCGSRRELEPKFCHIIELFDLSLWSHQGKGWCVPSHSLNASQAKSSFFSGSLTFRPAGILCMTLAWNVPRTRGDPYTCYCSSLCKFSLKHSLVICLSLHNNFHVLPQGSVGDGILWYKECRVMLSPVNYLIHWSIHSTLFGA